MAKKPGSIWIDGETFQFVDANGNGWNVQGDYVGVGGKPGSVWIEPDGSLHYCGVTGYNYKVPFQSVHTDAACHSSVWVEGTTLTYAYNSTKYVVHGDVSHTDGGGTHTDVPHSDHNDAAHGDGAHGDSHTDQPHFDGAHGDTHDDTPHYDQHGDYQMGGSNFNYYWDCTYVKNGQVINHLDHTDHAGALTSCLWHDDAIHTDSHDDSSHGDSGHADSHTDSAHNDAHSDAHSDQPHQDTTHSDGGGSHVDKPVYVGP